mmetsp:Transcript_15339/g.32742  ORF Transcript_15339/g.32742 Transcript_15339/m.32742 type:complete len:237 (-) Transcript_15339:333-1043(-)
MPPTAQAIPSWLYVPNLIGCLRVAMQLGAFAVAVSQPVVAGSLYMGAQALDAVDGMAARALGQSSELGRVLDMVTDRASTICLCLVLAHLYPGWIAGFAALITIDLFSHWYHMHATLISASASHKASPNWVVRLYYRKPILFTICAATELWYISLYALHFAPEWLPLELPFGGIDVDALGLHVKPKQPFWAVVFAACTPLAAFKQVTNVVQLVEACKVLVRLDAKRAHQQQKQRAA